MPKIGPEDGAYDPFKSISNSLSELAEPPRVTELVQEPNLHRKDVVEAGGRESATRASAQTTVESKPSNTEVGEGRTEPPKALKPPESSALAMVKRFKTSREEARQLDMAAVRLGARLGVRLDFSKLTRALWDAYLRHEDDILRNVPDDEIWERPSNGDAVGLADLDKRLSDLVNDGFMIASRRPRNIHD